MTNLVILLRQKAYTTRCKNSVRLNLLNLFDIRDKSAIFFYRSIYIVVLKMNKVLLALTAVVF